MIAQAIEPIDPMPGARPASPITGGGPDGSFAALVSDAAAALATVASGPSAEQPPTPNVGPEPLPQPATARVLAELPELGRSATPRDLGASSAVPPATEAPPVAAPTESDAPIPAPVVAAALPAAAPTQPSAAESDPNDNAAAQPEPQGRTHDGAAPPGDAAPQASAAEPADRPNRHAGRRDGTMPDDPASLAVPDGVAAAAPPPSAPFPQAIPSESAPSAALADTGAAPRAEPRDGHEEIASRAVGIAHRSSTSDAPEAANEATPHAPTGVGPRRRGESDQRAFADAAPRPWRDAAVDADRAAASTPHVPEHSAGAPLSGGDAPPMAAPDMAIAPMREGRPAAAAPHDSRPSIERPTPAAQAAEIAVAIARGPRGEGRMTVQLDPESLGKVEIRIDRPADAPARIRVTAESADTLALLARDRSDLGAALDRAGVPTERVVTFHCEAPGHQQAAPTAIAAERDPWRDGDRSGGASADQRGGQGTERRPFARPDRSDDEADAAPGRFGLDLVA